MGCCRRHLTTCPILSLLTILALASMPGLLYAETCATAVHEVNQFLKSKIDEPELVAVLQSLNASHNTKLPPKFVTKKQAQKMGWRPGQNLWAVKKLKGKSIGGDLFTNREGQLPNRGRTWHEADLAYKGGHRGAKRLVYSTDGLHRVTVDHYQTFTEVPTCQ
jgi:ribonuclease T1